MNDGTNNSYEGVTGYKAVDGYDMATGVGTVDALRFRARPRPSEPPRADFALSVAPESCP